MKAPSPPQWAYRFLHWFVADDLQEEVIGDLEEAYHHRHAQLGKTRADLWFMADVLRFFRPYSFEKYSGSKQYLPMFKNYFKIAVRNLIKRKGFTAINLGGLTISLAVLLVVGLFVTHHRSYDQHYPKAERTYRLENVFRAQTYAPFRFEKYYQSDRSTQLATQAFLGTFAEVEEVAYLLQSDAAISRQEEYFVELEGREKAVEQVLFTNTPEELLSIFPQEFQLGSAGLFSRNFQGALLTESLAQRLFGDDWALEEVVGQTFQMPNDELTDSTYTVAGVISDPQPNSHFTFTMILHTPRIPSWGAYTYFTTATPMEPAVLRDRINQRYAEIEPDYGQDERYKGVRVQQISDIHLAEGDILYELRARISPTVLAIFTTVAFVILFITWTNYMNLSIAMYSHRQKEIGMRKVLGARSQDIVAQLLVEIVLTALLAFPLALWLVSAALPAFNELMDLDIPQARLLSWPIIGSALGVTLLTGLLSGLYPALIFSRKGLLKLFKARLNQHQGKYGFGLRRVLIGAQFALLVLMLSLTGYVYLQMNYIQTKDLGFEQAGVIEIPMDGMEKHQVAKGILQQVPAVEVVGAGRIPGKDRFNMTTYLLQGEDDIMDDANVIYADRAAMQAIGVDHPAFAELADGKDRVYLINRTLADKLMTRYDLSEPELIGMTLVDEPEYTDPETGQVGIPRPIAGILPDMHYFSLKYEINPLIFAVDRERGWTFNSVIRLKPGADLGEVIPQVEEAYYAAGNTVPFDVSYLDQQIERLYESDQRTLWLISLLSLVAILLAVMGLVGLVSFLVFTRKKEIGIRKVLGASIGQILLLINREFLVLMLIATVIATPLVYLLAGEWLSHFAYRIYLNPALILAAGLGAMLIVVLVVSLQSRRAALTNPGDVLTEE